MGAALFNFGIQLIILLLATLAFGSFPASAGILFFFPATAIILIWATAIGLLLLAALNVYLRDMQYLVEVLMLLLMWGSPIVYSWSMVQQHANGAWGWVLPLYTNNPLTLAIVGFHRAFWTAGGPDQYPSQLLLRMGIAILVGLVALFFCQRVVREVAGQLRTGDLGAHMSIDSNIIETDPSTRPSAAATPPSSSRSGTCRSAS